MAPVRSLHDAKRSLMMFTRTSPGGLFRAKLRAGGAVLGGHHPVDLNFNKNSFFNETKLCTPELMRLQGDRGGERRVRRGAVWYPVGITILVGNT